MCSPEPESIDVALRTGNAELPSFPSELIETTTDGVIRVTGSRVSLYAILDAVYSRTPIDRIKCMYPTIPVEHIGKVIVFCNQHASELRQYYTQTKAKEDAQNRFHESTGPFSRNCGHAERND